MKIGYIQRNITLYDRIMFETCFYVLFGAVG